MKVTIIGVGKLKEKYLKQGIEEYAKRLSKYTKFDIIEVPDEQAPENLSPAEMIQVKQKEGERILSKIKDTDYVYALVIQGKLVSSEELAKTMEQATIQGKSHLVFIIGGSLGLSDDVIKRSNEQLSFGRITLPHQLMRLVLSEQVYRGFRIMNGHAYHK
ncbi:23S rRNA (pseudouridine(1915)-N(3))-methyltransferase RlmH [Vagococcus xieshaowenii]|uniref:Ribosomal RNA large subunit methyltransferase H n=1 Tax=Vagococcus xieshaowenii TaxID=2562451 RepID=A0AAJ5EEX8_9ENTE|nr:23S rRNA (pseudouridine(1915)-N(3))-methyltransferase RlmH [Vagococcus xieshaowenii]QCA27920.1 23S rRNA (pseudouridine(1915)-N(3))-methyltransferase RlmH [Vagococcus xieshaowenii]TFZ39402.1 23S rRNA (pseudouridine(1915)-N(3))-methyltransferase RlmH [Vagococcus xieshaowenii]